MKKLSIVQHLTLIIIDTAVPLDKRGPFDGRSYNSAWNYFHINSIDKDSEGNYLISARHYNAIFKINGTNGDIIWQLGGSKGSDFEIPSDLKFAFQHDARFQYRSADGEIERISFFDNAAYSAPGKEIAPRSRGRYIDLNNTAKTLKEIGTYHAPDDLIAHSQGSFRFLPNGNKLANWGSAGAITEFADNGTVLFHAYLDSYPNKDVQSYRGFRANWTGLPSEEPAVLAVKLGDNNVTFWVSWNGDTETKTWRFHLRDKHTRSLSYLLGSSQRLGFETSFETTLPAALVEGGFNLVFAEALGSDGSVLGTSRSVAFTEGGSYGDIIFNQQTQAGNSGRAFRLEL